MNADNLIGFIVGVVYTSAVVVFVVLVITSKERPAEPRYLRDVREAVNRR